MIDSVLHPSHSCYHFPPRCLRSLLQTQPYLHPDPGLCPWNVGYIQGDPQDAALITLQGQNPCGTTFSIEEFHNGYTLQGCGGDSMWLDQDGAFHASCAYEPQQICGLGVLGADLYIDQQFCC
jgi:hypothetical protein